MRCALLIAICLLPLLPAADEEPLPRRAQQALDEFAAFEREQAQERIEFVAGQRAGLQRERDRLVSELKRSVSRRSSVPEQSAVYRAILAHDPEDPDARAFFAAIGTLDVVLSQVEVHANTVPEPGDLLGAATALGAEPLTPALPDAAFSASSIWGAPLPAHGARYAGRSSWSAGSTDAQPWLQVDLGTQREIVAVGTMGRRDHVQRVTAYTLAFSRDGETWVAPEGPDGKPQVFDGNLDQESEVRHDFPRPVSARYVRFHPVAHVGYRSMRVEVYGY